MIAASLLLQQVDAIGDTLIGQLEGAVESGRAFFDWERLAPIVIPRIVEVAVVLIVAFGAYALLKMVIRRIMARQVDEEDPVVKRLREQRAQTIGGLLGNVALVVVVVITILTVLGLFFDVAPLIASVGVLGLAVSFGAQSLVKDIITGIFMLLEGQFGLGDVVRVGDTSGTVEKITLRTTILRDVRGVVHIIPNGEITRVSNLTKTWSRAVLDVGVAYKEDVDHVIEVLREIGQELHRDPEWGTLILEEPTVPGIENLGDSAVVVRLLAKTLPLKQWDVERELRRRIKKRFDQDGIEMPFPHVTFYWGDDQAPAFPAPGREPERNHAGGTAGRGD